VLPCVTCVSCVRPHATPIRAIMIALLLSIKQPEFVCITRTPSYHDSCVCCRSSNRSLRVCIITPSPCFARFHCQPSSFRSLCVFDNGAVALPLRQHGSKDPEFVTSSSIRSLSPSWEQTHRPPFQASGVCALHTLIHTQNPPIKDPEFVYMGHEHACHTTSRHPQGGG
jgi:hypothetical protein